MFFLAGAASSVLDFLGTLQGPSSTQQSSAQQSSGAAGTSAQTPFDLGLPSSSDAGAATGATGGASAWWSSPGTMSALLSAQGQSDPAATGTSSDSGSTSVADLLGTIEQLLGQLENQLGAGQPTGDADSTDATHGAGDHHHGGLQELLQALDGQSGSSSTGTDTTGTTQTVTNPDGSTTTTITYADGSTVTMTMAASTSSSSDGSANSTGSGSGTQSFNPLERLIQLQANMFAAATAGQTLSTTA